MPTWIGIPELLIILLIVVIVFGAKRLPEIGSGLGKAIKNFKSSTRDVNDQENQSDNNSK